MRKVMERPDLRGKGRLAPVEPVQEQRYYGYPFARAKDGGATWYRHKDDVKAENSDFRRETVVNTRRLAVLGLYRQHARSQRATAAEPMPYKEGQKLNLTITKDSGWKNGFARIPKEERTAADWRWARVRKAAVAVAGIALAVVAIGGTGDRMSQEEATARAQQDIVKAVHGMTGAEQYSAFYINGGPGNDVASFDDTSGRSILSMGISRAVAELNQANVVMGSDCLERHGYNISGPQSAAYHETADGNVTVVSRGGVRLHFALEEGVLQPADPNTIATLQSFNCETDGVTGGLASNSGNSAASYDTKFIVAYDTLQGTAS